MDRALLVVVLAAVAVVAAYLLRRGRAGPPPTVTGHGLPDQLDRRDFDRPEAPWLVAVFTSSTCHTCAGVWDKARHLACEAVVVQQLDAGDRRDLHRKYAVTAVPGVVVADADGQVHARFLGPVTATDLWATVAELRDPGTLPTTACDHGVEPTA